MKVIIVTGSVGSGKTTLSKKLAGMMNFEHVDVNKVIKEHNLSEGYDKKRETKIIDTKKLNAVLMKEIRKYKDRKGVVIDSHLSHHFPKRHVSACIVTKCDLKVLETRLRKRKYSGEKVRENLDAEIFDVCLNEAKENYGKIFVVDTTEGVDIGLVCKEIGDGIGI